MRLCVSCSAEVFLGIICSSPILVLLQWLWPYLMTMYSSTSGEFKYTWSSSSQERVSQRQTRLKPQHEAPWDSISKTKHLLSWSHRNPQEPNSEALNIIIYTNQIAMSDSPSPKFPTSLFKVKLCVYFFLLTQG